MDDSEIAFIAEENHISIEEVEDLIAEGRIGELLPHSKPRFKAEGFVYIADFGDAVKVGFSVDPDTRLKNLSSGSPFEVKFLAVYPGSKTLERVLHRFFRE